VKAWIVLLMALCLPLMVQASEEDGDKAPTAAVAYVTLAPALVGNFGDGPKLKFFKADLSLRVSGADVEAKIKHHEPLIRNQLVMLFSQQTDEAMAAAGSREVLRAEALKQVQDVMTQEEGKPLVEDLLFNNLIIQ
jgi:flagellar FliL protein